MGLSPHAGRRNKRQQEDAVVHVASSPQPKRARKGTALNGCGLPPLLDFSQLREAASRHSCRDKPPLVGASRVVSRKRLSLVEDAASDTDAPAKRACQFACSQPGTTEAASNYCGTAEGLEKVLDFPVRSSSSNAHAFRPRDAEQRSPDKPSRIMRQASQLLAAVQQQQQQAGGNPADQGQDAAAATGPEEDKEWQRLFACMELHPKQQGGAPAAAAAAGTATSTQGAVAQGGAVQLQQAAAPTTPTKQEQQAPAKTPSARPGSFLRSEFVRVCQQRTTGTE